MEKNEIKFRLFENGKANFYLKDHSLSEETYELIEDWVISFDNKKTIFIKELPKPNLSEAEYKLKMEEIEGFYFRQITEKTVLICISSFMDNYIEKIEKIMADNQNTIENSENMIIDVRNNLGGTDDAYAKLLPYINTNPTRVLSQEFLVTQTTIDEYQHWLDITPDDNENLEDKKSVREFIAKCKGKMGEFIQPENIAIYIDNVKPAEHSPKQIVILVNRNTASSGEGFVFKAKQSKKVKIMGTPTYGALDYGSTNIFDFGCKNYTLMLPTWRSMRLPEYPIDNIGIQPDIYLDKSINNWIQFAVDYLENK